MSPQVLPLVLLVMAQLAGITVQATLPLLMPSERLSLPSLVLILIMVVKAPLRFGDRQGLRKPRRERRRLTIVKVFELP